MVHLVKLGNKMASKEDLKGMYIQKDLVNIPMIWLVTNNIFNI